MNQDQLEKVLNALSEKLETQWHIKPEINYQGIVILRNFAASMKSTTEEQAKTTNAAMIKETIESFNATSNNAEWTQVIGPTGHLAITYQPLSSPSNN